MVSHLCSAMLTTRTGKWLDRTYRLMFEEYARTHGEIQAHNEPPDFPIEKTRMKGIYAMVISSTIGIVGYGLVLMTRTVSFSPSL